MSEHVVASADQLEKGESVIVDVEGMEIGVFNVDGEYYAYPNWCPHQGAPVCEGGLSGTTRASYDRESLTLTVDWVDVGHILNCPWHGWEFDVRTGDALGKSDISLPSYSVEEQDGQIMVTL
jgi:nitrite reductase/ring-hydroxylating ferredoxin subunit